MISVVTDQPSRNQKTRRLPGVYFGRAQLFADRDLTKVVAFASDLASTILDAYDRSTFSLHAVEYEGRQGLYGKDLFNRSAFRRKLARAGVTFAPHPFVTLEDGTWISPDWDRFEPQFLVLPYEEEDPTELMTAPAGLAAYNLSTYKFGLVTRDELSALVRMATRMQAIGAGDPRALLEALAA